jgi:hypothetical protein
VSPVEDFLALHGAFSDCGDESIGCGAYHVIDVLLGLQELCGFFRGEGVFVSGHDTSGMVEDAEHCSWGDWRMRFFCHVKGNEELHHGFIVVGGRCCYRPNRVRTKLRELG